MKRIITIQAAILLPVIMLVSCTQGSAADVKDRVPAGFIKGFDASYADWYDEKGEVSWSDTDGTKKDFLEILKSHGVNTIRLRIWHNPGLYGESVNAGDNTLSRTINMAKKIKSAGLDLMVDFHYSDTWADPGRQIVPKDWESLASVDEIASALSEYTADVLMRIRDEAGIVPKYVQIGNEINPGLLVHKATDYNDNNKHERFRFSGRAYRDQGESGFSTDTFTSYLKAGADAVRAFDKSVKIVLHVASTGYPDWRWFFDPIRTAGVPFDMIGYSYYPWESGHGTVANIKKAIKRQREQYGVDVIIAECSSHWHDDSSDGYKAQCYTYQHMQDAATKEIYADLETGDSESGSYVRGTPGNQAKILRHIIAECADAGGSGVFVWGGDLFGNYKWGMFDETGRALQSMDEFK